VTWPDHVSTGKGTCFRPLPSQRLLVLSVAAASDGALDSRDITVTAKVGQPVAAVGRCTPGGDKIACTIGEFRAQPIDGRVKGAFLFVVPAQLRGRRLSLSAAGHIAPVRRVPEEPWADVSQCTTWEAPQLPRERRVR
jgi:hypothetical protein